MKFTKEVVDKLADDLLIGLSNEENKMVLEEMDAIDKDIDIINTIPDIDSVEPMSFPLDNFNARLREDIAHKSVDIDDLLKNASNKIGREIEVPKVVE